MLDLAESRVVWAISTVDNLFIFIEFEFNSNAVNEVAGGECVIAIVTVIVTTLMITIVIPSTIQIAIAATVLSFFKRTRVAMSHLTIRILQKVPRTRVRILDEMDSGGSRVPGCQKL